MRYHFHHRVLLLDVRRHLVCYAHLCLAHVFQSPGHDAPTSIWKDVLLPPGHMVHPIYSHRGHTGHCTGKTAYSYRFFYIYFWYYYGMYKLLTSSRWMEILSVESALLATKTTDIVLDLSWLPSVWCLLSAAIFSFEVRQRLKLKAVCY